MSESQPRPGSEGLPPAGVPASSSAPENMGSPSRGRVSASGARIAAASAAVSAAAEALKVAWPVVKKIFNDIHQKKKEKSHAKTQTGNPTAP